MDHDRQPGAEHLALLHRVAGEDHRVAGLPDVADHLPQEAARANIHARGGLVEQDDIWLADESQGRRELPLVAAAEVLAKVVLVGFEAHALDHLAHNLLQRGRRHAADAGVERDGLAHSELVGQRVELRAVAQVLPGAVAAGDGVAAPDEDLAAAGLRVAGDHTHRRRLSCAIDAEQAEALTRWHTDVDAAHGVERLLGAAQAPPLETLREVVDHEMLGRGAAARRRARQHRVDPRGLGLDRLVALGRGHRAAVQQPHGLAPRATQAEAPLDHQAQPEPQGGHEHQAEKVLPRDIVGHRTPHAVGLLREDADAELLRGEVHVVVDGDVDDGAAEVVVREEPREDRLAEIVDGHELRRVIRVQIHDGDGEHGDGPGEDVADDQRDIRGARH
mmetsp:Transcript_121621/g.349562  ORF Transcript_121621/g.349562 Transcript_121621/m.349562 type:complete len:390 (-) Transcript_121621:1263-2432(-)